MHQLNSGPADFTGVLRTPGLHLTGTMPNHPLLVGDNRSDAFVAGMALNTCSVPHMVSRSSRPPDPCNTPVPAAARLGDSGRGRARPAEREEADKADGETRYGLPSNLPPERRAMIARRRAKLDHSLSVMRQRRTDQVHRWSAAVIASSWKKWCVRSTFRGKGQ